MRTRFVSVGFVFVLLGLIFFLFTAQKNTATATADITPPTSAATIANTSYGPNSFIPVSTLNGTATDTESGMGSVTVSLKRSSDNNYWDGSTWGSSENWLAANLTGTGTGALVWTYNAANVNSAGFTDGATYTLTPLATDVEGNNTNGTSDSFKWDATAPTVTITAPAANLNTNSTSATVTATTNENANCQYKLDSGSFSTMSTTGTTTHSKSLSSLSVASHTVSVKCTDGADNTSATATRTWTVSTTGSGGGSGSNSNTNSTNSNTNSAIVAGLTRTLPASLTDLKARNEKINCRASDSNTLHPGLNVNSARIKINGTWVTATTTIVTTLNNNANGNGNGNGNTNSSYVKTLDFYYQPNSNSYYPALETVDAECEIYNNNNLRSRITFAFDVGTSVSTNSNTNSNNSNTNSGNSNTNSTNQNTNSSTGSIFFTDSTSHWGKTYVEKLHTACAVDGYKDAAGNILHEFRPDMPITRAELAAMILKCKNATITTPGTPPFFDVPLTHWAVGHIQAAKESAIVGGYPDGSFQPNRSVLRSEAVKMILLGWFVALDITGGTASFSDVNQTAWYYKYVAFAVLKNFINGLKDAAGNLTGQFGPEKEITRAEAAKVIMNVKGL